MAYNVKQMQKLQEDMDADDPLKTYAALQDLRDDNAFASFKKQVKQGRPQRRNTFQPRTMQEGGQPDMMDTAQNLASKGRYGDTMLMHVTPEEVHGLSSLRGGVTINPETGLPEAFPWLPILAGAAIGGVGSAATGGDPIKGALLGGIGGFMPTALGGLAGATGLSNAWIGLGPIGQGMLSGAAMGGISSLFGKSDNPLRDMLFGAAMGGVGGAVFGGGEIPVDVDTGATTLGSSNVPILPSTDTPIQRAAHMSSLIQPAPIQTTPSSVATKPFFDRSINPFAAEYTGPAVSAGETFGTKLGLGTDASWYKPSAGSTEGAITKAAEQAGQPIVSTTQQAGQPNWWDRRTTPQKIGLGLGAGVLGLAALEGPPQQAPIPGLTTASAIPEVGPFPFRTPIGGRDEEFYERTIGEGRTPEEAEYFSEEEVNVAKEGGLLSVIKRLTGGRSNIPEPGSHEHYAKYGTWGGPAPGSAAYYGRYGTFGVQDPYNVNPLAKDPQRNPHLQDPIYGLTSASSDVGVPAPSPFEFPDVTPFQDNVSSFDVEDVVGRITGQDQIAEVPVVVPEQVTVPVPTDVAVSTDTSALGDLLSRFQQTAEVDPIASLVSEVVTSSDGGILELAVGGNTSVFEGRVQGQGDGMADQVAFNVIPQTPQDIPNTPDVALLSSDEYVVPADVVSMLGNGSSTAGAQALDQFNKLMRQKAHGTNKQQTEINPVTELSSLV